MNRADEIVMLGIGVPEGTREERTRHFIGVLERMGYKAKELTEEDIIAQGAWFLKVRSQAASQGQP